MNGLVQFVALLGKQFIQIRDLSVLRCEIAHHCLEFLFQSALSQLSMLYLLMQHQQGGTRLNRIINQSSLFVIFPRIHEPPVLQLPHHLLLSFYQKCQIALQLRVLRLQCFAVHPILLCRTTFQSLKQRLVFPTLLLVL